MEIKTAIIWILLLLLPLHSCREETDPPVNPQPEPDCYEKMIGTYTVNPGEPGEFQMTVERVDSSNGIVYFRITNFNNQFDVFEPQYCMEPTYGINYTQGADTFLVDRKGHRYYVFGYEDSTTAIDENSYNAVDKTYPMYFRLVNIAFYIQDNAPFVDTFIYQLAVKDE